MKYETGFFRIIGERIAMRKIAAILCVFLLLPMIYRRQKSSRKNLCMRNT